MAKVHIHKDFEEEYKQWLYDREMDQEYWKKRIKEEARKELTYSKAKRWLKKFEPELQDRFYGTTEEILVNWIRNITEDSYQEIIKEQDSLEIQHHD